MLPELKERILRVADAVRVVRYYEELVKDMIHFSNAWNALSARMKSARDVDDLSKAIYESAKEAARLSHVLERHERIVTKLGDRNET